MEKTIDLGRYSEITLTLKPVFDVLKKEMALSKSGVLSGINDKCKIMITVNSTAISGNINGVRIVWLFMDDGGKILDSFENKERIVLSKSGNVFSSPEIRIPMADILKAKRKNLLGNKGKIGAQVDIEQIDPVVISSAADGANPLPPWDASFFLRRTVSPGYYAGQQYDYELASHIRKNQPAIGEELSVKIVHGTSIPDSARFFFSLWENDFAGAKSVLANYTVKSTGYSSLEIQKKGLADKTANGFVELKNTVASNLHVGCGTDGKLNYFDQEGSSPEYCEFNYLLGFSFDDEKSAGFEPLGTYQFKVAVDCGCLQVRNPKITAEKFSKSSFVSSEPRPKFFVFAKFEIQFLSVQFGITPPIWLYVRKDDTFQRVLTIPKCKSADWSLAPAGFTEKSNKICKDGWIFNESIDMKNHYAIIPLNDIINDNYGCPKDYFQFGGLNGAVPVMQAAGNSYVLEKAKKKYDALALPLS